MLIELIQGMQEIKLQNSEEKRSSKWAASQVRLFDINLKAVALSQYQDGGAFFINQFKDMVITVISAMSVINGKITLGDMIAIQFILGQLNGPIQQIISFIRNGSEAKLSLDRIVEIHERPEEDNGKHLIEIENSQLHEDIVLNNVSFKYNELKDYVIRDLTLVIPKGKKTAIVGASGSGKTTLVKLLLGMYSPTRGEIKIGEIPLNAIKSSKWRSVCGAVMQDGYIFNDTIANNIAESDIDIDNVRLNYAAEVSNIKDFVMSQALGFDTIIGAQNSGISQGQKQRILIARLVYKNSHYLFFDEATNSLDAHNELTIVRKLTDFYENKTVVIVAHRLSTVRDADNIVVMDNGKIVECGTHSQLIENRGYYFNLISNQLELGS
jgi:ATP-binding cassette subfamily B protein